MINNDTSLFKINYQIISLSQILSFHISVNTFHELKNYIDVDLHYTCMFKNMNKNLNSNINDRWFYYDDLKGYIEILDGYNIGYKNYRQNYQSYLLIYTKN